MSAHTPQNRFSVVIRWNENHQIVPGGVLSGYHAREDAERIAESKRREIETRGMAAYVHIDEAHEVSK